MRTNFRRTALPEGWKIKKVTDIWKIDFAARYLVVERTKVSTQSKIASQLTSSLEDTMFVQRSRASGYVEQSARKSVGFVVCQAASSDVSFALRQFIPGTI